MYPHNNYTITHNIHALRTQLITISYVIHVGIANPYGIYSVFTISNCMDKFIDTIRTVKDTILYTRFHTGWVFAVLIGLMALCVYSLTQLV